MIFNNILKLGWYFNNTIIIFNSFFNWNSTLSTEST